MAQQSNMTITLLPWASQARKNAVAQNARANENVESRKLLLRFFTPAFMHLQIFRIFGVRMYAPGTWYWEHSYNRTAHAATPVSIRDPDSSVPRVIETKVKMYQSALAVPCMA